MRFTAPLLFVVALAAPAPAADPLKVDFKKGVEFTGRAEATVVEICPRVTGYIDRVLVKEGEAVRKGDVLAEVDDRPYKLKLDEAKAELAVAQAQAKIAVADLARMKDAFAKGAASKDEVTRAEAAWDVAKARVDAAKAVVAWAELNLAFTKLTSPIDGRVGRFTTTPGNLLVADGPSIVSVVAAADPIAVSFDVDERLLLALLRAREVNAGKPVVEVGLADEDGYPHKAALEATPVKVDPATGTARFRATLANPKGLIAHGSFVRVRLTVPPGK
jgi:RND family efflux transporter MFP subunit